MDELKDGFGVVDQEVQESAKVAFEAALARRTPFHNRQHELEQMQELCALQPVAINVVVGPRSCGKTALFAEFAASTSAAVIYINCRTIDMATPASFVATVYAQLLRVAPRDLAQQLKEAQLGAATLSALIIKEKVGGRPEATFNLGHALQAFLGGTAPELNKVINLLGDLTCNWKKQHPGAKRPVIIVDEANTLMAWRSEFPKELTNLLKFFVHVSKEQNNCHVVLVTSEYGFLGWLEEDVIGDFSEEHARGFLELELAHAGSAVKVEDDSWQKIYSVCGGNAGLLKQLAQQLMLKTTQGNWEQGLRNMIDMEAWYVKKYASGEEAYYSAAQYADAILRVQAAAHNAVDGSIMESTLGRHLVGPSKDPMAAQAAGKLVLRRLVERNALGQRPVSEWALDIPSDEFVGCQMLVTAPTVINLACTRLIQSKLHRSLDMYLEQQKVEGPFERANAYWLCLHLPDVKLDEISLEFTSVDASQVSTMKVTYSNTIDATPLPPDPDATAAAGATPPPPAALAPLQRTRCPLSWSVKLPPDADGAAAKMRLEEDNVLTIRVPKAVTAGASR